MTVSGSNVSMIFVESSVAKIDMIRQREQNRIDPVYFPIPCDIDTPKSIGTVRGPLHPSVIEHVMRFSVIQWNHVRTWIV